MEAQDNGLAADAARGFFFLSRIHYVGENSESARHTLLRGIDAARLADPQTQARQLVDSARCLLMLERDVSQAQAMIVEARASLGPAGDQLAHVAWARGLLGHFCGDVAPAVAALEEAVEGYKRAQSPWETFYVMAAAVICHLESGDPAAALERCPALREVGGKLVEGSEPAVAAALEALARLALGEPDGQRGAEEAARALKELDAKAI